MSVLGSVELLSPIVFMNLFQAPSSSVVWAKAPDVSTLAITPSKVAATTQRKTVAREPNAKAPLRLGFRSCGIPLPEEMARAPAILSSRIRALLRRSGLKGIVQEGHDPGNDRHIRKVEDVPAEAPAGGLDVKKHKVHHPRPMQAVKRVADRAPDNKPKRERRQARGRPRQPDPEQHDRGHLERQQRPDADGPLLPQQAITDAGIP